MMQDFLTQGLKVVICGTAVGNESSRRGHYYAHPGNRFWRILFAAGITPIQFAPEDDHRVVEYGVGLTDLAKLKSGTDRDLIHEDFDIPLLERKILDLEPEVLCFNGKTAGKVFLRKQRVEYGFQPTRIGKARIFVAPSTSPAANGAWDEAWWLELGKVCARADSEPSAPISGKSNAKGKTT